MLDGPIYHNCGIDTIWRLRSAAKHLVFTFEDPFVFTVHNNAYSVDEDLHSLEHFI